MEISEGADCCCPPNEEEEEEKERVLGCPWFHPSWGPTLPPTPTTRPLPLKESWTLGAAKPWSLGWAARQPRVSRVAQRRTPTTGMVGKRRGAEIEGSLGEPSLPRRAHVGGMSVHCTHRSPEGHKPHIPLSITRWHAASSGEDWKSAPGG